MIIVDRTTFLAMPVGTVYQKYEPCNFSAPCIKGETVCEMDWYEQQIGGDLVGSTGSDDFDDFCEKMERGESIAVDLDVQGRDGLFDHEQLFAVWERTDVQALIDRLALALAGAE